MISAFFVSFLLGMFQADASSDYHSPKTGALAGAGAADPYLADAIWLNPAATSFTDTYNIHVGWNKYHGPDDSEPKGRVYAVGLLDGRNEFLQAGLGFVKRADGNIISVGASRALIDKKLGIGLGSKYAYSSDAKPKARDVTASIAYRILPQISVSLLAQNLLSSSKTRAWGMEREYKLATKFGVSNIVSAYIDPHFVPRGAGSGFGYETGVEFQLLRDLFLRVGKSKNALQPNLGTYGRGYGWGAGWIAPKISLDFGVYRTLEPVMATNSMLSGTVFY